MKKTLFGWAIALSAIVLSGCSGLRIVDTDVVAFSTAGTPPLTVPAGYRFERLPSQQIESRAALESLLQAELAKVGLQRNDASPQYSVQLDVQVLRDWLAPWSDTRFLFGYARPFPIVTRHGVVMQYPSFGFQFEPPYYRRDITITIRRLSDGQVVYETKARHEDRWPDDAAILAAMFQSALKDFPNPPQGMRRVAIEIPR